MDIIKTRRLLNEGKSIFDMEMRVAYYARVSTDKDEQAGSLVNQVGYYEDLIRQNQSWHFAGGYVDEGISGTGTADRSGFLRMISDARSGKIDFIITKEISRFSRNTLDSIGYTRDLLEHGVGVLFQSDGINTLLPDAELRLTIMSGIAQDEVRKLSERVSFGFRRSMEQGRVLGVAPIGYVKKDGMLEIEPVGAALVKQAFERYAVGDIGLRRLAAKLGISYHTLHGVLTNPKYKGYYCGNKTKRADFRTKRNTRLDKEEWILKKDDRIPAIVEEPLWDTVNAIIDQRSQSMQGKKSCANRYPYSGKVVCAVHGAAYHRQMRSGKECWSCMEYRKHGAERGCTAPTLYTADINAVLTMVIDSFLQDKETVIDRLMEIYSHAETEGDSAKRAAEIESRIQAVQAKQDRLLELAVEQLIDKEEFSRKNTTLRKEIEQLRVAQLENQRMADAQNQRVEKLAGLRQRLTELLTRRPLNEQLCTSVLERIEVSGNKNRAELSIYLHAGKQYSAAMERSCLLLWERGISQAQVSRLEKSALKHMQKYI